MKQYIRAEEMKELFSVVPLLKNMKLSLRTELQRCKNYSDDEDSFVIESMTFGNCELSDMPFAKTNETSDKTSDIALEYHSKINNEAKEAKKAIKEIVKEIYCIDIVIDKIEIGLNSIGRTQQEVLKLKYWEGKTWDEITEHLKTQKIFYSKKCVRDKAKLSVKKLNTASLIDLDIYKNVKTLINKTNN